MIVLSIKLLHYFIRVVYMGFRLICFVGFLNLGILRKVIEVCFLPFTWSRFRFGWGLDLSSFSLVFIGVVRLITSVVLVFSYSYMNTHYHSLIFIIMLNLFVISIIFVISFNNLLIVILGWDGLGVISFFLIMYYQSPYRIFSGWFTLLINRLGDRFLIITVVLLLYQDLGSSFFSGLVYTNTGLSLVCLILGLITKRAIFPFSPWLPIAMRAPTPISSLVHSSTLVTAGLYLIMRISRLILVDPTVCQFIIWVRLFTTLYAGLRALVETDLKKLVALSTLRHLGFIGISFSRGILMLSYFHLLSHALFKRLIFIGVGDWISSGHHYQDSRSLSGGVILTPLSSFVIITSILSLLGIPFIIGFYSKDFVLESLLYSSYSSAYLVIVYLNVFLTFNYTLRVVGYSLTPVYSPSPFYTVSCLDFTHYFILSNLGLISLVFPYLYLVGLDLKVILSIPLLHVAPICLLVGCLIFFIYNIKTVKSYYLSTGTNILVIWSISYMLSMGLLYSSLVRLLYLTFSRRINKFVELGALSQLSQLVFVASVSHLSSNFIKFSIVFLPLLRVIILLFLLWVFTVGKLSFES